MAEQDRPTLYVYIWQDGKRQARAVWRLTDRQLARVISTLEGEVARRRILKTREAALVEDK